MVNKTFNDALIECVKACGGSKVVGLALWPAKGVEAAQRSLLACLNPDRQEKLQPDEVLHVLRMARERGCHVGMQFIAGSLSYAEPTPIEPEDERAKLQRDYIEAARAMQRMAEKIERISMPVRSVA